MPGSFIISFDCEGNWGIADRTQRVQSGFITKTELIKVYDILMRQLSIFEMPATFAFVMAFILSEEELTDWLDRLTDVEVDGLNWMRNFRRAQARKDLSGWFCPEALDLVRDNTTHEIACHGFRHIPFGGNTKSAEASYEIENSTELARKKFIALKTFVFPRNRVGHLDILSRHGFIGFRNAHPDSGRRGRLGNLLRELNIVECAQSPESPTCGLVSIPGGYFLNWRQGLRRAVPESVTLFRWQSILEDAASNNRIALLWLHPHNLIDGYGMAELLGGVLRIAARLRETNGLSIITQQQYCEQLKHRYS
jgi:hypothetical protein